MQHGILGRLVLSFGAVLSLVACGGGTVVTPDGDSPSDAGVDATIVDDGGTIDSGIDAAQPDSATPEVDAAEPEVDAAPALADAGSDAWVSPGSCDSNDDCGGGRFCLFALGSCGGAGTCEDPPFICGGIYLPVCGCDNNTYDNECSARAAGMSIKSEGDCP